MSFVQFLVNRINVSFFSTLPTRSRLLPLPVHLGFEAFQIDGQAELAGHLLLLVQSEAIRVVELECRRSWQYTSRSRFRLVVEYSLGDLERGGVPMFFFLHDT